MALFRLLGLALLLACLPADPLSPQDDPGPREGPGTVRLYLDCSAIDCFNMDYNRQEVPFVDWVRDIQDANLYVVVTQQTTGAGGRFSELIYEGREEFQGKADTLTHVSLPNSTSDERREGLIAILKIGLMRYVGLTPVAEDLFIGLGPPAGPDRPAVARMGRTPTLTPEDDPWNFWVFSVTGRGSFSGETSNKGGSLSGSVSANRVTDAWKIQLRASTSYRETDYESEEIPLYVRRDHSFSGTLVKSLASQWSLGLRASARRSTYYNYDFAGSLSPVLEYSFYPYEEATRRNVTLQYTLDGVYNDYREETIYFKTQETFLAQSLSLGVGFTQPWGSAYGSVEAGHQLNDWDRHHASVFGGLNLRVSRGLSLNMHSSYSRVHDLISIAAGAGKTAKDILLRRRQLQTDYRFNVSVGLTYRFGSIFNNIVNPRLEGPGGGGIMMIM